MEWIFLSIVVISISVYLILDRYFEYKEKTKRSENNKC